MAKQRADGVRSVHRPEWIDGLKPLDPDKLAPQGPHTQLADEVEREFAEALRQAAWIFENEKNGRFLGCITACRAVARFIYLRRGGAALAGPFVRIAEAFEDLEKGGKPRLFLKKTEPDKERSRSPERKVIQELAAAALEVLHRLGDEIKAAAEIVARDVNRWPGMAAQEVNDLTLINWRKQRSKDRKVTNLVEKIMEEQDPRRTVQDLLSKGPPGLWS